MARRRDRRSVREVLDDLTGDEVDTKLCLDLAQSLVRDVVDDWVKRVEHNPELMRQAKDEVSAAKRLLRQTRYLAAKGPEIKAGLHFVNEYKDEPAVKAVLEVFPDAQVTHIGKLEEVKPDDKGTSSEVGPDQL